MMQVLSSCTTNCGVLLFMNDLLDARMVQYLAIYPQTALFRPKYSYICIIINHLLCYLGFYYTVLDSILKQLSIQ